MDNSTHSTSPMPITETFGTPTERPVHVLPTTKALALATCRSRAHILYNWSGVNAIAPHSQIHFPETESQVASLVRQAKGKICIVGSGLSYEQIASVSHESSLLLNMKHFNGLRRITDNTAV